MKYLTVFVLLAVTVTCKPMTKEYSESLAFGWPNEFWECWHEKEQQRTWSLEKPEEIKFRYEK